MYLVFVYFNVIGYFIYLIIKQIRKLYQNNALPNIVVSIYVLLCFWIVFVLVYYLLSLVNYN